MPDCKTVVLNGMTNTSKRQELPRWCGKRPMRPLYSQDQTECDLGDPLKNYQRELLLLQVRVIGRRIRLSQLSESRISSCIAEHRRIHKVTQPFKKPEAPTRKSVPSDHDSGGTRTRLPQFPIDMKPDCNLPLVSPSSSTCGDCCGFGKDQECNGNENVQQRISLTSTILIKGSPSLITASTSELMDDSCDTSNIESDGSTLGYPRPSHQKDAKRRGRWFRRRSSEKNDWFMNRSPSQEEDTKCTMVMDFYYPEEQKLRKYKLVYRT